VPRPSISHLQRQTRKQKSHLGPRGRRCEGDRGGSCLGLSEADSTHIAQRVASPMLRPRPPQHTPASAMPTGVTRTHDAAARGRRGRPWPWRRRRLRRFRPKLSRSTIKRAYTHDRRGRAPTTLCGAALCSPTARPGLFRRFAAPADAERGPSASRNMQGQMSGRRGTWARGPRRARRRRQRPGDMPARSVRWRNADPCLREPRSLRPTA